MSDLFSSEQAPFSLKKFLIGLVEVLTTQQFPITTAKTITGYSFSGVLLPKVPNTQTVGKMYAVIVGGADGKYHLYLSTEKLAIWTNADLAADRGFLIQTTYTFYMAFANYSSEDGSLLDEWISYESESIAATGTVESGAVLEDSFVADGILWSSYNIFGEDGVQRKSASRILPVMEA